jgi:pimeloyl-ACP methyl ester carboxylesterase
MNTLLQRQAVQVDGTSFDAVVLGDGRPTVVFVNGLGSPLEEWSLVAPTVAEQCRVVCYDRRQPPPRGPVPTHDAAQITADLRQLLTALGITGPLVLVGHSWGGAVIRRYAHEHPAEVVGMVLVDASHEAIKGMIPARPRATRALYVSTTLMLRVGPVRRRLLGTLGFDRLPPDVMSVVNDLRWVADGRTSRAEFAGIGPSLRDLASTAPDLPPVPIRVLLAGGRGDWTAKLGAKQLASIRAVWEQATRGRSGVTLDVVPDSGHYISLDQPQAVIDAIDDVIGQVSLSHAG